MLDAGRRGFVVKITYCAFFLFKLCAGGLFSGALVYPKIMEDRADDGSMLLLVQEGFAVYLDKSDVLAQDFNVTIENDTYSDTVVLDGGDLQKDLYHNSDNYSSLVVRRKQGGLEVQGILNNELIITPVYASVQSADGSLLHKVSKVEERSPEDSASDQKASEAPGMAAGGSTGSQTGGTAAGSSTAPEKEIEAAGTAAVSSTDQTGNKSNDQLETFRVEICFLVTDEYRGAFNTIEELIIYVAILVNAVKLRYLDTKDPRIRFQFNGIDMLKESEFVVYHGSDVDATETLINLVRKIKAGRYGSCDAVFVLTSKSIKVKEGSSYSGAQGAAVTGGVCTEKKVGIVTDIPRAYTGARTLSHELAHTLGAVHDGAGPNANIPGHLGAKTCRADKGFLMGRGYLGTNKYKLSTCSKRQIQALVKTLPKDCIEVQANANYSTNKYPGQSVSLAELCKLRHGNIDGLMPYNDRNAPSLQCLFKCCWLRSPIEDRKYNCAIYNMLDKMECATGKTCRRGICAAHQWA